VRSLLRSRPPEARAWFASCTKQTQVADPSAFQQGQGDQPRYENPSAEWSSYTKAIIMPTRFRAPEGASESELVALESLNDCLHAVLVQELGQVLEIVTEPGPGTLRIEASVFDGGRKLSGISVMSARLPEGAAVSAVAASASAKPLSVRELNGEMKITDAVSGDLIADGVDRRVGRKDQSASLKTWGEAYDAIQSWARETRSAICKRKGMANCPDA